MQEKGEDEKKRGTGTGGKGQEDEDEEEEEACLNNGSHKALTGKKTRGHHAALKNSDHKFSLSLKEQCYILLVMI